MLRVALAIVEDQGTEAIHAVQPSELDGVGVVREGADHGRQVLQQRAQGVAVVRVHEQGRERRGGRAIAHVGAARGAQVDDAAVDIGLVLVAVDEDQLGGGIALGALFPITLADQHHMPVVGTLEFLDLPIAGDAEDRLDGLHQIPGRAAVGGALPIVIDGRIEGPVQGHQRALAEAEGTVGEHQHTLDASAVRHQPAVARGVQREAQ